MKHITDCTALSISQECRFQRNESLQRHPGNAP